MILKKLMVFFENLTFLFSCQIALDSTRCRCVNVPKESFPEIIKKKRFLYFQIEKFKIMVGEMRVRLYFLAEMLSKGTSTYYITSIRGVGVRKIMTLLNKMPKLYSIKLMTRGSGVKNCENGGDIICGCLCLKTYNNLVPFPHSISETSYFNFDFLFVSNFLTNVLEIFLKVQIVFSIRFFEITIDFISLIGSLRIRFLLFIRRVVAPKIVKPIIRIRGEII